MAHGLRKIAEVLDEHAQAGDSLSITLLTTVGQVMTFSGDNWRFLPQSVEELISSEADEDTYVVIVRRPDEKPAPGKILPEDDRWLRCQQGGNSVAVGGGNPRGNSNRQPDGKEDSSGTIGSVH